MDLEAVLDRKIDALFPDAGVKADVIRLLSLYGTEKYEQEPIRVRLAILKLSGSDLDRIEMNTRHAKDDPRDLLAWAESPSLGKAFRISDKSERKKLIDMDKTRYQAWLAQ